MIVDNSNRVKREERVLCIDEARVVSHHQVQTIGL